MSNTPYRSSVTGPNIENPAKLLRLSPSNTEGGTIYTELSNGKYAASVTNGVMKMQAIQDSSSVIANPTLVGTEANLTGLQVNDTKYKVPQGTVTSVGAGTGLAVSGTASVNPTIGVGSGYTIPTTAAFNNKMDSGDVSASATGTSTQEVGYLTIEGHEYKLAGGSGVTSFNDLTNRPSYNNTTMTGTTNIPEVKTATWDAKQDAITDLATIRSGAALGATALQSVPSEYITETELAAYHDASKQDVLTAGTNIAISNNVISATDTTYTAGTGISITNNVISNTQTPGSQVSGTSSGGNWTALTIDGTTNNIPTAIDISTKMDKANPTGTGTLSMNSGNFTVNNAGNVTATKYNGNKTTEILVTADPDSGEADLMIHDSVNSCKIYTYGIPGEMYLESTYLNLSPSESLFVGNSTVHPTNIEMVAGDVINLSSANGDTTLSVSDGGISLAPATDKLVSVSGTFKATNLTDGTTTKTMTQVLASAGGVTSFNELTNRPSYNGTTMTGSTNIPEVKTEEWDAKQDQVLHEPVMGAMSVEEALTNLETRVLELPQALSCAKLTNDDSSVYNVIINCEQNDLVIGQSIYIAELDVPDLWISEKADSVTPGLFVLVVAADTQAQTIITALSDSTMSAWYQTADYKYVRVNKLETTKVTVPLPQILGTPEAVSTTGVLGTSTNYARADHVHAISLASGDAAGQVKIAGTNVDVNGFSDKMNKADPTGTGTFSLNNNVTINSSGDIFTSGNLTAGNSTGTGSSSTINLYGTTTIGTSWNNKNLVVTGTTTSSSFIKSGGTETQFLKANGSVDSTAYMTVANPTGTGTFSMNNGKFTVDESGNACGQSMTLDRYLQAGTVNATSLSDGNLNTKTVTAVLIPKETLWLAADKTAAYSAINSEVSNFSTQVTVTVPTYRQYDLVGFRIYVMPGGTNTSQFAPQTQVNITVENAMFSASYQTIEGEERALFVGQGGGRYPNDKNVNYDCVVACYQSDNTTWNFCFLTCGTTYGTVWGARDNKMYRIDALYK